MPINGLQVGNFGFFKDPDLTYRIDNENLYDQIDANGWIKVWFGGDNIFLPGYGEFNVYLTCEQTFFWDIVDENGKRTKDGFEEMLVPYNPNVEPHTGDIIPLSRQEVFDNEMPVPRAIAANLWFYTNLFRDNYYRYNLIVLNRSTGLDWPDEGNAKIVPMNENVTLESGDVIVGYRPKPEYMNQLAVMKKISSGKENSILFKFKVDLQFLSNNPESVRKLRIFTLSGDNTKYLLYPKSERDIIWTSHKTKFMDEYYRYLLYHGIQEYAPDDNQVTAGNNLYESFMEVSNRVLQMDIYNFEKVAKDIDNILAGENIYLTGYSKIIIPTFLEWLNENIKDDIPIGIDNILRRVILTTKYFKGFYELDKYLGLRVGNYDYLSNEPDIFDGNVDNIDGSYIIANGGEPKEDILTPNINIVMIDGVRQFEDGYIPNSAMEYRYPNSTSDYKYAGDTGNGLYKISVAGKVVDIFCEMEPSDGSDGGWMYLIVGGNDLEYISNIADTTYIEGTVYTDSIRGIGWGKNDGSFKSLQFYNMPFSSVKLEVSGDYNNPINGTGYMEIYTSANGNIVSFIDDDYSGDDGQSLYVDGQPVLVNDKTDLIKYKIEYNGSNDSQNNLVIKMRGDSNYPYCRRYVRMLAVK